MPQGERTLEGMSWSVFSVETIWFVSSSFYTLLCSLKFMHLALHCLIRCCWWGRGVLQVRGVCTYGKLNYYLGKRASDEGRPSLYPDLDFCKNPGAVCSDKRAQELRWVTGMFHWAQTVQKARSYNYVETLKQYVDGGNYEDDTSFIGMVNTILGGSSDEITKRTQAFYAALKVFGLISDETDDVETAIVLNYCGVDFDDASSKCSTLCVNGTDAECPGEELCFRYVTSCASNHNNNTDMANSNKMANSTVPSTDISNNNEKPNITTKPGDPATNITAQNTPMALSIAIPTTNYCGTSWEDASAQCAFACLGGTDRECPPGQKCFGDITTCSGNVGSASVIKSEATEATSSNYCGVDWTDASMKCAVSCPGGSDAECPVGQHCYADLSC